MHGLNKATYHLLELTSHSNHCILKNWFYQSLKIIHAIHKLSDHASYDLWKIHLVQNYRGFVNKKNIDKTPKLLVILL